jgi:hypothetical protein
VRPGELGGLEYDVKLTQKTIAIVAFVPSEDYAVVPPWAGAAKMARSRAGPL